MKKIIIQIMIVFFVMISCDNVNKKNAEKWEKERIEREKEIDIHKKLYADSIVHLSFCGIKLGEPFGKIISEAKNKGKIKKVDISNYEDSKTATCEASLLLPNSGSIDVKLSITSYKDTITSFLVTSDDYDTHDNIIDMYKDRYILDYCEEKKSIPDWGDYANRSLSTSWIWKYKNQSIRLSEFDKEKRENYIKDYRMRSPQNRYGVRYTTYFQAITIIYTDFKQVEKVEKHEAKLKIERYKVRKIEERKIHIKDSIMDVKRKEKIAKQDF